MKMMETLAGSMEISGRLDFSLALDNLLLIKKFQKQQACFED